jgi:multidrug efflux pump subunit AcrA (membrane-fusion protein)
MTRFSSLTVAVLCISAGTAAMGQDYARKNFTAEVSKGDLQIEVELTGRFVAEQKDEIRIEPKTYKGDLIVTQLKPEGASVAEGEVLMEFDPQSLERSLEDARNEVSDKQVALDKADADFRAFEIERENTLSQNRTEWEMAQKDLAKVKEDNQLQVVAKDKSIKDAEDQLADARVDLEQLKQLYAERELHTATENILIEREERRVANLEKGLEKTKREVALWKKYDVEKTEAEKALEVSKKDAALKKAEIKLDADLKEKQAEVVKAQRALDKAQREVDELEVDSRTLQVVAPRDGIVFYGTIGGDSYSNVVFMGMGGQDKEMRIGGRVRTHQILMTVASMERLNVQMQVLENEIQHMKSGLPITVRPDAFPSLSLKGKLTKVGQVAARSGFLSEVREFTVNGEYEGVYAQLRSGMNCRVTVHADTVPDAVLVPVLAVFTEGSDYYCLVVNGSDNERRAVKLGATNGTSVQITEGLRAGEAVVLWDPSEE